MSMITLSLPICLAAGIPAPLPQQPDATATATAKFDAPIRLRAGDDFVRTESPGYAAPCWFDVDGDGKPDLVVGQFHDGKLKLYRGLGDGKLAAGTWLQAGGADAVIPGVW